TAVVELRQEKPIDGRASPGGVADPRRLRGGGGREGPVVGPLRLARNHLRESRGTPLDPAAELLLLRLRERLLGGTLVAGAPLPEQALVGLARDHRRALLAAARQPLGRGQVQSPFALRRPVALHATSLQQRKHRAVRRGGGRALVGLD